MEKELEMLMKRYSMDVDEAADAIDFVQEFLEHYMEHTEEEEPYATHAVHNIKIAYKEVGTLRDILDEGEW